ncbi:MAG: methyltransferase [Oscillospiraceae bacterium]|nr:methyltransferase [Oscillospiraceae bacterium]
MPTPEILWPGGPRFIQAEHFRLGTDCVLLADFVNTAGAKRGIELGCASGAAMLLLLERSPKLFMTGLEIVSGAASLARENMALNDLTERSEIITGDIRDHRALFRAGSFDLLVCNPPYFPQGSGALPQDADRAAARSELLCTLSELCAAAAFLLQTGGRAFFVHRPERLSELLVCLTEAGLEPKRLRLVCRDAQASPSLVLVEARRGGRPGLTLEPSLYLQNPDGSESDEYKHIYHRI